MIGQLIPQIVYDIIGRLVPGLVLLGACRFIWPRDFAGISEKADPSSMSGAVAFLIAAYVLALMLEGVSTLTLDKAVRPLQRRAEREAEKHVLADFSQLDMSFEPDKVRLPGIPIIYDAVRLKNPGVGSNIVKLRAEVHLYRTLMIGMLLILAGVVLDMALRGSVRHPLPACRRRGRRSSWSTGTSSPAVTGSQPPSGSPRSIRSGGFLHPRPGRGEHPRGVAIDPGDDR